MFNVILNKVMRFLYVINGLVFKVRIFSGFVIFVSTAVSFFLQAIMFDTPVEYIFQRKF